MGTGGVMNGYDNGWVGGVVWCGVVCVLAGFGVGVLGSMGWLVFVLLVGVAMDVLDKTRTDLLRGSFGTCTHIHDGGTGLDGDGMVMGYIT